MPHIFPAEQNNKAAQTQVSSQDGELAKEANTVDQLLASGKTAIEIGKLCMDNPSFCEKGTSMVSSAGGQLLQNSGRMLDYLSSRFGAQQPAAMTQTSPSASSNAISQRDTIPVPTSRADALRALEQQ